MKRVYTSREIKEWINHCIKGISCGKIVVSPMREGMHLDDVLIDELANLLQFRGDIHTVSVDPAFTVQANDFVPYLFHTIGTVKLFGCEEQPFINRLELNSLKLTDPTMTTISLLAHKVHFKQVFLMGNVFTKLGFNQLVRAVISNELQTQYWVEDYFVSADSDERTREAVNDLYNAAQIFSYLFLQNLPYDLQRVILERFYYTLKDNGWIKYIEKNSRLDILFPPNSLDETVGRLISWLYQYKPECLVHLTYEEIQRMIVSEPTSLVDFIDESDFSLGGDSSDFEDFTIFHPEEVIIESEFTEHPLLAPPTYVKETTAKIIDFAAYRAKKRR